MKVETDAVLVVYGRWEGIWCWGDIGR